MVLIAPIGCVCESTVHHCGCNRDLGNRLDAASLYLYSPQGIEQVPSAICRAARGDLGPLAGPITGAITSSDINWVMFYSMQCREEVPFESPEEALAVGSRSIPGSFPATSTASLGLEFLDDPTQEPDTACIAEMPPPDFR